MKSIFLTFIYVIISYTVAEAYTAYYYYGQYFKRTSYNTVELIKPIKSDDVSLKQEYTGDFRVPSSIVGGGRWYRVTKIADSAFEDSTITSLTLGENIDSIGESACANCESLTEFYSNKKLTYIGDDAFYGCSNLTKITLPEGFSHIGNNAFQYCRLSEELSLPSSVVYIGFGAFFGTKIRSIYLSSNELAIGGYAFAQSSKLEIVNIASISNWCNYVFENEYSNPLYFARTLKLNGDSIVDLDLNNEQILSIPIAAFIDQITIKTVKLGPNLDTISSKAFYTTSIDSIFITSKIPPLIDEDSFTYTTYRNAILTVPYGCADIYRESSYWSYFNNIVEERSTSGINNLVEQEEISINGRIVSVSKPILLEIYSVDGNCLFNDISNSYSFISPGVYIVNGVKYAIQ